MNTTKMMVTEKQPMVYEVEPSELCGTNGGLWMPDGWPKLPLLTRVFLPEDVPPIMLVLLHGGIFY